MTITTENSINSKRIELNIPKLLPIQNKYADFVELIKIPNFQNNILKSQWASRLIIKAEQIDSPIFKNPINYEMYFERCLHQ